MERARTGDLDAFNDLVERHQTRLYNLALRLTGSREAAEDVTQDAFLAAFNKLDQFAGQNFLGWLLRICANTAKDALRRQRRRPATSFDQIFGTEGDSLEPRDPSASVETEAERAELGQILWTALRAIPADQRQAIVFVDVEGYSYHETAGMTGVSVGTVKSRVSRGRARLRAHLSSRPELLDQFMRLEE